MKMQRSDAAQGRANGWVAPAFAIVAAVTVARLVLLAFNRTDLFVDESQYWFWGQHFAFGYYSKPPLIAWVIGATTWLAGSDAPFWVRAPASVFHAATALILAALGARLHGRQVAIWVAASYVTLPMVALGSLLISTDTIMAPFFAAAIYFHRRLVESGALRHAVLTGGMIGLAMMAKYAGAFLILGVLLGAILFRDLRLTTRNWVAMLLTAALLVLPNVLWNLHNGMATASHTMDNIGWVHQAAPLSHLNPVGMVEFFFSQFGVFGPVLFGALILAFLRPTPTKSGPLLVFVGPAIVAVTLQALLGKANANWAASAYFAGTVVAVAALMARPVWLRGSLVFNSIVSVVLPVLTLMPGLTLGGKEPLLARWLGRAAMSQQILAAAKAEGGLPVVADDRDILADLFYTGRDGTIAIYATRPLGPPSNHYQQTQAIPDQVTGPVLFVSEHAPICEGVPVAVSQTLATAGGAYARHPPVIYRVDAGCLHGQ